MFATDDAISPIYNIYNEMHLRRAVPYLGGIESKLLSLNKIARILDTFLDTILDASRRCE